MEALALDRCVDLLECGLVEWCAPTLAGLKPASMFNVVRYHELGARRSDDPRHAGSLPLAGAPRSAADLRAAWDPKSIGGLAPAGVPFRAGVARPVEEEPRRPGADASRQPDAVPLMGEYTPRELDETVAQLAARLAPTGVRVRVMAVRRGSMMVFVYRPDLVEAFVQRDPEATLLELEGYDVACAEACVEHLRARVLDFDANPRNPDGSDRFPHEMGLLLGYPLDDVLGFVNDRANPLLRGHWNVHSDLPRARRIFSLYDACTTLASARHDVGEPVESLAQTRFCPAEALLALYA